MTFEKFGDVAQSVQGQLDDQLKQVTRWMKPYSKKMVRLSHDLRPYGGSGHRCRAQASGQDAVRRRCGRIPAGASDQPSLTIR